MMQVTHVVERTKREWQNGNGKILLAIAAGWGLSLGVRLAYPVMLPYLRTAYGLTLTTAGLLLTILWVAYAVGQLPGGVLADRFGEGTVMVVSMLLGASTLFVLVLGGSTALLFVMTALFGLGAALFGVVHVSAIADVYPENHGTAYGVISAMGDVGNTVLPPVAGFVAALTAWQFGFGFTIPLFFLLAVILWVVVPSHTSATDSASWSITRKNVHEVLAGLAQRPIGLVLIIQILGEAVWASFTGFFPLYLIDVKGMEPALASTLFALFFSLGVLIKVLTGNVYDRAGARYSLALIMGTSGIGLAILTMVDSFWLVMVATVITSTMLGRGTVALPYMTNALPVETRNTGLGVLRTVYIFLSAISPAAVGAIADAGYFNEAFWMLAALSGLAVVLTLLLPNRTN